MLAQIQGETATMDAALLIPQPLRAVPAPGAFALDQATAIVVPSDAHDQTRFTADQIQQAIGEATGLRLTTTPRPLDHDSQNGIRLVLDQDRNGEASQVAEGYTLAIAEEAITITAGDQAGLFYGAQTLIQLLRTHGRRLPGCRIEDWPALPHRGVMLDVSRGRVPTRATLIQLARTLAHYKINQLQLYTEHTFQFPSHAHIGQHCGSLTADDMRALDAVCRDHHIELVPNLQSTGHMRHILSLPEYEHLAETPWRWSITPAREETYQFLDDLYGDLLPAFSSPFFNIDSDEAWDFGRGQARERAAQAGVGRAYLDHILRLRELAAKHGRRIMVWADVLHHYPELIPEIPDDIVLLDWSYESQPSYPTLRALADAGRPFYVCPGTSTWNTIFPRIDNAIGNTRTYVREGIQAGAIGMLMTDWGDYGHYQPLSHSWYGYLFGAEMAWTGATTPTETFDESFGALFLNDASGRAVAAIRRLGRAVEQPGIARGNGSESVYALFEDPLAGRTITAASPAAVQELADAGATAIPAFALLPDSTLRHELSFAAHQMIYAAQKVLLGRSIHAALRELTGPQPDPQRVSHLDPLINELDQLRTRLTAMRDEFEQLWLARSQRAEIAINLDRYDALRDRFDASIGWLRQQRDSYAAGRAIDAELTSYESAGYRILWEEGLDDLRRLVEAVGRESIPPEILLWLGMADMPATQPRAEA
jgi:hexosaminidase